MKIQVVSIILFGLILSMMSCRNEQTNLLLLGTVHQPVDNFNSDTLYNILEKIRPDVILFEVDSSFFTENFTFKKTWESNENLATVSYMENFEVVVRPYDFTGRNAYRIKTGSRPTDTKTIALIDSLHKGGALSGEENTIYEEFLRLTDALNAVGFLGVEMFNNPVTDSLSRIRQYYQYEKLLQIVDHHTVFSNTYHTNADGDSISYAEGYRRAGEFWNLRNKAMAKHILQFAEEFEGKNIVVLNGYFHRYYLDSLLRSQQAKYNFILKDWSEY